MSWNLRKALGILTYDEHVAKEEADKKTLEEWRNETESEYLKIRDNETNASPYITYFFRYCRCCDEFLPENCFDKQSKINAKAMLLCSKLRLNTKLLQK